MNPLRKMAAFGIAIGMLFTGAVVLAQNTPRPGEPAGREAPAEKRPDVMGRIVGVSEDGRVLTIAVPPRPTDGSPARDAKPEEVKVVVTDRTKSLFFGVEEDEARPMVGQQAMVWLEEGSKDQAARIRFMRREGEQRPDVQGRVVAVSPDRRTVTVETREVDRATGQEKSTGKVDVRIAPYTQSLYFGVEPGSARPTVDYLVIAWLEKGSKDTAVRIRFMRNDPASANVPR